MEKIRGIVVDVYGEEIMEVSIEANKVTQAMAMVVAMPGETNALFTVGTHLPAEDKPDHIVNTLWVNDNGLLLEPERFQLWANKDDSTKKPAVFAGNGIILGTDLSNGESISTTLSRVWVTERVIAIEAMQAWQIMDSLNEDKGAEDDI